ncbi:MAG: murein L,D-transpeptidase catalytic domain family protein [Bacteroidetes bacterium]|jgi:hypothetical protein|nr:murein L,D-transpeptidase catalytic domain family protein [Bacteroidota bacterium]
MKNSIFKITLLLLLAIGYSDIGFAKSIDEKETFHDAKTSKYIQFVYNKIKFNKSNKLSFEVFKTAFYGYLNMLEAGKISNENILSICDFTLSSTKKRLWVIDLKNKKLLQHSLVAHGMGTGDEYATAFSNQPESHQSSLGFYVTAETYIGNNGYSLKLQGEDGSFNSNAYERAVVIHGAAYVSEQFAKDNDRLGRSHGCPALPVETAPVIIDQIKNGSCFFIYHTANNYLAKSRWLNSSVSTLPKEADLMDIHTNDVKNNPRYVNIKSNDKPLENVEGDMAMVEPKEKIISSVVIINQNSRTGVSDTTLVK